MDPFLTPPEVFVKDYPTSDQPHLLVRDRVAQPGQLRVALRHHSEELCLRSRCQIHVTSTGLWGKSPPAAAAPTAPPARTLTHTTIASKATHRSPGENLNSYGEECAHCLGNVRSSLALLVLS